MGAVPTCLGEIGVMWETPRGGRSVGQQGCVVTLGLGGTAARQAHQTLCTGGRCPVSEEQQLLPLADDTV